MRIGRTLPPAAAPLSFRDLFSGLKGATDGAGEQERLKLQLKEFFNKKHCVLVSSGKAALTLILLALKEIHPERNQVLIPAFSCYSVPSAIVRAGLQVQLCDIDLQTLDYDFAQLEAKIKNPNLLCVLSLHLFGLPANIERLKQIRRDPAVTVVEDAAQAMGGEWQGKRLGTMGDVGFFSLGRGKAVTAIEGGIILTDDDGLGDRLHFLEGGLSECSTLKMGTQFVYALALLFLLRPAFYWIPSSIPFLRLGETRFDPHFSVGKLSGFQAGLLRDLRHKISGNRSARRANIQFWIDKCSSLGVKCLENQTLIPDLIRFPLHLANRDAVERIMEKSRLQGYGLARTYPDAIHGIQELKDQFVGQDFANARQATQEMVTLPVHGFLKEKDRERIAELLATEAIHPWR